MRYSTSRIPRILMEQKIQELQAQIVTLEKTLANIKLALHRFAERETETKEQADELKNVL